jgi:arginase family enzyme
MPLRMLLDSGAIDPDDAVLIGSRNLDPPEREYMDSIGLRTDAGELEQALEGTEGVYVALDVDSLEPGEISAFMPEPGGLTASEVEDVLRRVQERSPILGAGFSGLAAEPANVEPLTRFSTALGL